MTPRRRWAVALIGAALLMLAPYAAGRLPAGHSQVPAGTLLGRIEASASVAYSGYAQASGSLPIPVTSEFGSLADLLGGQTNMRVWWRGTLDWRVDTVDLNGETDVHQDSGGIWTWSYESNTAVRTNFAQTSPARLPRSDDLLPAPLARRLLSHAVASEVSRLPDARVAGHDAAGLRLRPAPGISTIDHVDVWALPTTGLPLRVRVYGSSTRAVVTTSMLDVSTSAPSADQIAFQPPQDSQVTTEEVTDVVSAIDRFANATLPATLGGLERAPDSEAGFGSVGVYGHGVTVLVALPLPPRLAESVTAQLVGSVAASEHGGAITLAVSPVNLRLTAEADNGTRWLLAGTVRAAILATASTKLPVAEGFFRR